MNAIETTLAVNQLVCWLGSTLTPPKMVVSAEPVNNGIEVVHRPPYGTTTTFTIPCQARWEVFAPEAETESNGNVSPGPVL